MSVLFERGSGLHWAAAGLLAGLLISVGQLAWAAPAPHILKGVVERFNHSPEGRYEGLLLKSADKLVQVNFPKPMAAEVTKAVATGDQISVVVVAEEAKGDHPPSTGCRNSPRPKAARSPWNRRSRALSSI